MTLEEIESFKNDHHYTKKNYSMGISFCSRCYKPVCKCTRKVLLETIDKLYKKIDIIHRAVDEARKV